LSPLVLYHANCADGFCAAWAARQAMPDAECVPVQYGQPPPDVRGRRVYVVDFSYRRPVLEQMAQAAASLVVLDHHKTAQADLAGLPYCTFDMDKSGGRLAWEHFHPGKPAPWLVAYTEDRDLWRWQLAHSRAVSAWLASASWSFGAWSEYAAIPAGSDEWRVLVQEGNAILRYQAQQVEAACANAREIELAGHKILAVNSTVLFSEVAGKLAEGRPFGAAWFVRADGKRQWSLRSRDGGVDVSEVAKARGGGGHRNAAGFEEPL